MNTNLLPTPVSLHITDESVLLSRSQLHLSPALLAFVPNAPELIPDHGPIPVELARCDSFGPEEYGLDVFADHIQITAAAPNGAFYALVTLNQLLCLNEEQVCLLTVRDRPTMSMRGISDDISRGQISTRENFRDIIRRMAYAKCNIYMPYFEDTFAFSKFPASGSFSDPVPQAEWRELVEYAKGYYITLIPIFNTIGHWDKNAKLEAFAPYVIHENDDPQGAPCSSVDVRKPEAQQMIFDMLDELVDVFGSAGAVHVGGDEVGDYTQLFRKDQAGAYYNEHFNRMYRYLKSKGIRPFMYSDMYTPLYGDYALGIDYIDQMPADMDFVYWDYACRADYPNIRALVERKKKFCISPATYTWSRMLPHHYTAWMNTRLLARAAGAEANGLIMSAWCDGGMTLREENWLGIYIGGLYAWNCDNELSFDQVISAWFHLFFGLEIDMTQYHSLMDYDYNSVPHPYNEAAYGEPIEFWYDKWQGFGSRFFREFWKDATEPVDEQLQQQLEGAQQRFEQAHAYFSALTPRRNQTAYKVFLFDILRSAVAARKIALLQPAAFRSREEARAAVPEIDGMLQALEALKEENRARWFDTNRESEWAYVEDKYDDLIESFRSLRRYCLHGKALTNRKKL